MEEILIYRKTDEKYDDFLSVANEEWKKKGIESQIIKSFKEWSENNVINLENLDDKIKINEKILDFNHITFKNLANFIVNGLKDERFEIVFNYFEFKMIDYLKSIKKSIQDNLLLSLKHLDKDSQYKEEKNCNQLTEALILESVNDENVSRALLDLYGAIYKSLIKYFLYNDEILKSMQKIETKKVLKEKKLIKVLTSIAKDEYVIFEKLYFSKIKMYGDKISRIFDSWLYEWENSIDVLSKYIKSEDYLFYSKLLAKINTGDII